jgi:branched-chain amino acid transport system ATP-binding protein
MSEVLLQARGLRKHFGGLVVTDGVDLEVRAGEIHALIGPNGAGKTTLVAQLSGELASDAGAIVFAGRDITRASMHQRARAGLVRSFQVTRLFRSLSVREHLAFAAYASSNGEPDADLLPRIGLAARAGSAVDALPHGEQRALEVALALATRPRVLLLDEPLAGLGPEESQAMVDRIAALRAHCAVLLIEHDVDAVFRIADRVTVMVGGAVLATGAPQEIRQHAGVIEAYLGAGS